MAVERAEERWARRIISSSIGFDVDRYDDGSQSSMPDALIRRPDGVEPMEVVSAQDADYLKLADALRKHGRMIPIDPAQQAWAVALTHATANVRRLPEVLPSLIVRNRASLLADDLPDALQRIGVEDAHPIANRYGFIHLSAAGWNSWDYDEAFGRWLDTFFARESDVPAKLARFGGKRQHAFVWVTSFAAWSVLDQLELDDDEAPRLPHHEPAVPNTLTDIWIASTLVRPTRGLLHWERGQGWSWQPFVSPLGDDD